MAKNVKMRIEDIGIIIFKVKSGSISYGTNITEIMAKNMAKKKGGNWEDYLSDVDIRGVFIPHRQFLIGPDKIDEWTDPNEEDTKYFSLEKFVRLALECNPNVVEQLFVRPEDIVYMHPYGQELFDMRYEFLTKNCYERFAQYAWSQANRMVNRTEGFQRNNRRQQLIEAVGGEWDPKNGMHLVRLLYCCLQILREGHLDTYCYKIIDLLLDIRNGKKTANEVIALANELFEELEIALKESTIPNVPNFDKVNKWVMDVTDRFHGKNPKVGTFKGSSLRNLPSEYEMVDQTTLFLISNPLVRKMNKSEAQGVAVPYKDWFTGLLTFNEFKFHKTTIEHIHKFVHQVRGCNPRHLDTIFAPEKSFLHKHPMTEELFTILRTLPTTKRAYHTAKGYITGNMSEMEKWERLKKEHEEYRQAILEAKQIPQEHWTTQLDEVEKEKEGVITTYRNALKAYEQVHEETLQTLMLVAVSENIQANEFPYWRNSLHDGTTIVKRAEKQQYKQHLKNRLEALKKEYRLEELKVQYRVDLDRLRHKKDQLLKKEERWKELSNKKGNLSKYPDQKGLKGMNNEVSSAIGKYGWNVLLASDLEHVVKMYTELLKTGTIRNSRAYEDDMYATKNGRYKTYEMFKEQMDKWLVELEEAQKHSKLGTHDFDKVQKQVIDFINRYHETL